MPRQTETIKAEQGSIINTGNINGSHLATGGAQLDHQSAGRPSPVGDVQHGGKLWLLLPAVIGAVGAVVAAIILVFFG
jgi:hypothetical protein